MSAAYLAGPVVPAAPAHEPGCTGKVAYASRADALRSARQGTSLKPYRCPSSLCGQWHLTHWRKRDQETRR